MPGAARSAQVDVDVLDLPVLVEADLAVLPSDPGLLVAAKGEPRVDHVVVVDPHRSRSHPFGELDGPVVVADDDEATRLANGMTTSTGPKISSCAIRIDDSTFEKTVGR